MTGAEGVAAMRQLIARHEAELRELTAQVTAELAPVFQGVTEHIETCFACKRGKRDATGPCPGLLPLLGAVEAGDAVILLLLSQNGADASVPLMRVLLGAVAAK